MTTQPPPDPAWSRAPAVSVIVPAYDQPEMLREALVSVADQDFDDFEVIVVDDGSPGDLAPAIAAVRPRLGERLRVVRQDNAGGAAARNRGIALARGTWIALLDHDDVWLPNKLRRQLEVAARYPEVAMWFCQFREFGVDSPDLVIPQRPAFRCGIADLLETTWIRTLSVVLIRRDVLGEELWFDLRYSYANDIDFYYRVAERHTIRFIDEVLVRKRTHPDQASRNKLQINDEMVEIVERMAARLQHSGNLPRLAPRVHKRTCRHLLAAAKAARAAGQRLGSRQRYRRILGRTPGHVRAWRGYFGTYLWW